jgi:hypothetical protein
LPVSAYARRNDRVEAFPDSTGSCGTRICRATKDRLITLDREEAECVLSHSRNRG